MKINKILITHCLPDDNPGGLAILWGMLKALKSNFPDCQYNLLSLYSQEDPRSQTAYRHISRAYPDLKIFGALLKHRSEYGRGKSGFFARVSKAVAWPANLIRSLLGLLWPSLLTNQATVNAFREADLILSRGSHIVYDNQNSRIRSILGIYMLIFPFLLAKRLNRKYVMYAHSISRLEININRKLFSYIMRYCHKILVREELSLENMINYYKIGQDKVILVPDAACAFETPKAETKNKISARYSLPYDDFLAVTVVRWSIDPKKTEACLDGMAATIDFLLESGVVSKCALVLQVRKGPADWEDDREVTENLLNRIKNSDKALIIEDDWIPEVLIAIYGAAKLTMVTRFHSMMFSLIGGTPPLSIAFSGPKSTGMMQLMGLGEFVLDQTNFSFNKAKNKLQKILSQRSELEELIKQRIAVMRKEALDSPKLLL